MSLTSVGRRWKTEIGIGDRISVRIVGGVAHGLGDPSLETLRDHVFEPLGLVVDLFPAVTQDPLEKCLEQAVVAEHLQRHPATVVGQPDTAIGLVANQALLGEPLDHARDRRRPDIETNREIPGGDRADAVAKEKDLLEIILLRRGQNLPLEPGLAGWDSR